MFRALTAQGFPMKDLAIYGDSAGGGLAAGAVLKLRDAGLGMPAAGCTLVALGGHHRDRRHLLYAAM